MFDEISKRIPPKASVFTAEVTATNMTLINLIGSVSESCRCTDIVSARQSGQSKEKALEGGKRKK